MSHTRPGTAGRDRSMIAATRLIVGMEVHVELRTRTKMFTRVHSPAHPDAERAAASSPNTLIDPVVLALPGALPVLNARAVELSIMVGLALGCSIAERTRWDRKSYFYPDLPKAYQISQHQLPLCFDGAVDVPSERGGHTRVRIVRAHLEEDAGKLLHEAPGGGAIGHSIVDLNRAGTPLLEIVTAPDLASADAAVACAQWLHAVCRWLGATSGVMQAGHMRFEPNINLELTLRDGQLVRTPIVEVKNLNSFKALRGAIEHESAAQVDRWLATGREHGPGAKSTRGWDEAQQATTPQRDKEDAEDYRYFPDPDLPAVDIHPEWIERIRASLPELPHARRARYLDHFALSAWEAGALVAERALSDYYEAVVDHLAALLDSDRARAGRVAATLLLQNAAKLANERCVPVDALGVAAADMAALAALRERGEIGANALDPVLLALIGSGRPVPGEGVRGIAERLGLIQVRDEGQLVAWCAQVLEDPANAAAVADVRAGKDAAVGRLVGDAMKRSAGRADAKAVRAMLIAMIRGAG